MMGGRAPGARGFDFLLLQAPSTYVPCVHTCKGPLRPSVFAGACKLFHHAHAQPSVLSRRSATSVWPHIPPLRHLSLASYRLSLASYFEFPVGRNMTLLQQKSSSANLNWKLRVNFAVKNCSLMQLREAAVLAKNAFWAKNCILTKRAHNPIPST